MGWALVATLLLVLQSFTAVPDAAAAVARDAFGNPLCITSGEHAPQAPSPREHGTPPLCCTLACSAGLSMTGIAPADPVGLAVPLHAAPVSPAEVQRAAGLRPPKHSPANPRAPPSR